MNARHSANPGHRQNWQSAARGGYFSPYRKFIANTDK
jgi:hypothetical protein